MLSTLICAKFLLALLIWWIRYVTEWLLVTLFLWYVLISIKAIKFLLVTSLDSKLNDLVSTHYKSSQANTMGQLLEQIAFINLINARWNWFLASKLYVQDTYSWSLIT